MFCSTSKNCSRISGFCHGGCKHGWEGVDCLEIRDYKVSRILGWTETVAVLSISLSVNLCVLLAYCKRRYAGPQKRRKLNISRYNSSRNFLSEEAQTDPIGLDDQEYGRREYNELQLLNGENHYWNM
ncbi:uncharacterized protein LOC134272563 [Saccostrea cucullata]|uniref:uncharacterized protein LOC134272563 n=1 Tax=Saccostrea cuccullata TaxID=36930 RepID=UPI002ED5678F